MKKILLATFVILLFLFAPWVFKAKADHFDPLPTEFAYCEKDLSQIRSPYLITLERIDKWEKSLQTYFENEKIDYSLQLHFYTYLYLAQRDAAFLSYNVHKCFVGSLDPLTKSVINAFFPKFDTFPELVTDPYSEELANQIWPPYLKRLKKEETNPPQFKSCDGKPLSKGTQKVAKWIPWITPLPEVPPPEMKNTQMPHTQLSDEQLALIYGWAGEKGLDLQWRTLANTFMYDHKTPLGKTLFVRSILMEGLFDAQIASKLAKYTYCIARPSGHSLIRKPSTPSYPSGHATQAGTAEVILSHFFPDSTQEWCEMAENSAESRIWAGVHTPQDKAAGMQLGREVGTDQIKRIFLL